MTLTKERLLGCLVALALAVPIGLGPEAGAGQEAACLRTSAPCTGEYAPGVVLVGRPASASAAERRALSQLERHLFSLLGEEPWDEAQLEAPREILSHDAGTVYALPVPVGQECAALRALRQDRRVIFAELDYVIRATDVITPNDPGWAHQWGPAKIGAPAAWDVTIGTSDVVVAIVDTGVQLDHEDLVDNLWTNPGEVPDNGLDDDGNGKIDDLHGWHFYDGGTSVPKEDGDVADDHGHGTHVAGIAAARINNGLGVAGMAGRSRIMPVKVLDASGVGWASDLAQGITYSVDNGAQVVNLSLGVELSSVPSETSETLQSAADYAHARGALLVAASGNGSGPVLYPGACEHVLAASATDQQDDIYDSRHGPEVDVAAPGVGIHSTGLSDSQTDRYHDLSGTSMATAHVAGLAALIRSARPDLPNVHVAEAIRGSAADVNGHTHPGWDAYAGWGRIEAGGAISAALSLPLSEYGVEMSPESAAITATMGSLATYALAIRNTGNTRDAYVVEPHHNAWETAPATELVGPMDPAVTEGLEIAVAIPMAVSRGMTDTVDVVVTSVGDPTQAATSTLTTTATGEKFYLPIISWRR